MSAADALGTLAILIVCSMWAWVPPIVDAIERRQVARMRARRAADRARNFGNDGSPLGVKSWSSLPLDRL